MLFSDFDSAAFLRDHWQKKPLLIRNPWIDWRNPLEPDELAGLACEEEVESRLIICNGDRAQWTVEQGPIAETRFATLGEAPWTLLVQAVDQHVPQVAALLAPFRFIPNWRTDDVMVSYASDGGGVGAHFDQYDVFLIQGLGKRRWRLGQRCDGTSALLPHDDLRLLANFTPTEEWVLDPGDILYLPPGIAHDGVAVGQDCMTYSIGFRAPARSELIAHWADEVLAGLGEDDRYADPDLMAQTHPGEIAPEALARLQAMVLERLGDRAAFARWFGGYTSRPRYPEAVVPPEEDVTGDDVRTALAAGLPILRNPASRFAFFRQDGIVTLCVDGECFPCTDDVMTLARDLCTHEDIDIETRSPEAVALIAALINQGSLAFDDEA
jgi:50S ribosomal protein L16 3-hydroxylase